MHTGSPTAELSQNSLCRVATTWLYNVWPGNRQSWINFNVSTMSLRTSQLDLMQVVCSHVLILSVLSLAGP